MSGRLFTIPLVPSPSLKRITPHLILLLHLQAPRHLLRMFFIQVLQQHILIHLLPLILAHVLAPAPHRARQPPRHIILLAHFRDGHEVRPDGENYAPGSRESSKCLPLGAEVVVRDSFVLLGCEPADGALGAVLRTDGGGPGQGVVYLDEVVILFGLKKR